MKIEIIKCLQDNFSYLLINEKNSDACVVDPGEAKPVLKYIEENKKKQLNPFWGRAAQIMLFISGAYIPLIIVFIKNKILENKENIKGEFVAVIERQTSKNQDFDNIDLYSKELRKMATKFSLTDIVEIVHKFTKINKNKIYKWLLKLKK